MNFLKRNLNLYELTEPPLDQSVKYPFRYIYLGFPAIWVQTLYHRFSLGGLFQIVLRQINYNLKQPPIKKGKNPPTARTVERRTNEMMLLLSDGWSTIW